MASDFRKFDEHGLPLRPRFEDLKTHDDEPRRRPKFSLRTKRLVLLGGLGLVIGILFGPQIYSTLRDTWASWLASRAHQKYWEGNYQGALADLSKAIDWSDGNRELYCVRAEWRQEANDLNGSLADWSTALGLMDSSEDSAMVHANRSFVYIRLERYREGLDDATQAVRLSPTPTNLNTRAYMRALSNMELEDGLADVNKALAEVGQNQADFLDTRGHLLYLLDRNEEALKDLDRAVQIAVRVKAETRQNPPTRNSHRWIRMLRKLDESLAVMYHHRGLVYDKLGRKEESDQDLRHGKQLGYDPADGVM